MESRTRVLTQSHARDEPGTSGSDPNASADFSLLTQHEPARPAYLLRRPVEKFLWLLRWLRGAQPACHCGRQGRGAWRLQPAGSQGSDTSEQPSSARWIPEQLVNTVVGFWLKWRGGHLCFLPHSLKRTVREMNTVRQKGTGATASQCWKHISGWLSQCPDAGVQRSPGNRKREQKPRTPGSGHATAGGEWADADHVGTEAGRRLHHALPHGAKALPAPQQRQTLRTGWGGRGDQ